MSTEWLGILLLAVLFAAIFIGFPIAFTLIAVGAIGGWLAMGPLALHLMTLQVFSVMRDPTLASVPFFLFMGYLLEQSGLMERLFRGVQLALGSIRGSLYLAVLLTATIFAAATGIVGSSVTLLGVMAAPAMKRSGYDIRMSAGAITAGGTLGILIPPSVMLIVMGPVVGVPATDLFAAAVIPGLLLASLYIVYTLVRSYINPALGPALPPEERAGSLGEVVRELVLGIAPVVVVIFATLGVILAGIATPTDAGAVGAFAVLLLTLAYRRMTWTGFRSAVYSTLLTSCMILLLVAASNYFGSIFSRMGSASLIAESLLKLDLPPMAMLILILGIIFVLGWPLEWVPIVLIVVPILLPLVQKLGIDIVWFCTLVAVCLQTAWLSPPVALSAYFLKGVVPEWEIERHLQGHAAVHGAAGDRTPARAVLPAARAVAARRAARLTAREPPAAVTAPGAHAPPRPLARAFDVLSFVASSARPPSASAIAEKLGLAPSSGHRLLGHLADAGLVVREPGSRGFRPSAQLAAFARDVLLGDSAQSERHAILAGLAARVGETCNLTMLDRGRVVYLDRVESHWPLRLHLAPGSQVPIHCTASGKLFLATLPKTRRAALLRATPLDRHAPGTIVDPAALERELDALRKRDLGIDCEEYIAGLVAVAVPVRDRRGRVVAAIAVHAPAARMSVDAALGHVDAMREAAEAIAGTVG